MEGAQPLQLALQPRKVDRLPSEQVGVEEGVDDSGHTKQVAREHRVLAAKVEAGPRELGQTPQGEAPGSVQHQVDRTGERSGRQEGQAEEP